MGRLDVGNIQHRVWKGIQDPPVDRSRGPRAGHPSSVVNRTPVDA